jgi:hypothetical protein
MFNVKPLRALSKKRGHKEIDNKNLKMEQQIYAIAQKAEGGSRGAIRSTPCTCKRGLLRTQKGIENYKERKFSHIRNTAVTTSAIYHGNRSAQVGDKCNHNIELLISIGHSAAHMAKLMLQKAAI